MRFAEAPAAGRSILSTASRTPGARAYRELARRLVGLPVEPEAGESVIVLDAPVESTAP